MRSEMLTGRAPTRAAKGLALCVAAAAALAGSAAIGGCGASATLDPVARAAVLSSQEPGATFTLSMHFSSPALPTLKLAASGQGELADRGHAMSMTMSLSGLPAQVASGGSLAMRAIELYPNMYVKLPPLLAGKLPSGKPWLKVDISKAASAAGISSQLLTTGQQSNPGQYLQFLRASSGNVSNLGTETVDGVPTTHYRATIATSKVLERVPAEQRTSTKSALEALGEPGTLHIEAWVDANHRVRRVRVPFSVRLPSVSAAGSSEARGGASRALSGEVSVDYTSYGAVPAVTAPPASEVFDATALASEALARARR